jgi:hypothetical protein
MPGNVAELQIKVKSDNVALADRRLIGLDKSGKKVEKSTDRLGRSFAKLGLATAAAAAGTAALWSTFNNVRTLQKLQAQLKTATGSVEGAEIAFAELQSTAAKMPNTLAEITTAFITLKNLGLDPSEAAILSYGNTAAAMGKSLDQFIQAVADASTREFERLKEFGIKAKQEGDRVSFTFRNVTTEIGNNSAEIEAFLQGLGNVEFAGSMAAQMDTIDGKLSNLADAWFKFSTSVGIPQAAIDAIEGLSDFLNQAAQSRGIAALDLSSIGVADIETLKAAIALEKERAKINQGVTGVGFLGQTVDLKALKDQTDFTVGFMEAKLEELELLKAERAEKQSVIDIDAKRAEGEQALGDLQLRIDAERLPIREKIHAINEKIAASEKSLLEGTFSNAQVEIEQIEKLRVSREKLVNDSIKLREKEDADRQRSADLEARLQSQKINDRRAFFQNVLTLTQDGNSKLFRITKAAALADAVVRGAQATQTAYATGGPFPANLIAGVFMAAKAAVEIKQIESAGNFANGGFVGGQSFAGDNLQANVNSGEAILNASQQRNFMRMANGGGKNELKVIVNNLPGQTANVTQDDRGQTTIQIIEASTRSALSQVAQQLNSGDGPVAQGFSAANRRARGF